MNIEELLEGLDPAQREAVVSPGAPLCIYAGAGSGKTRVLTRRIAYRVATETADAEHVLALTFSRRAAGELTHRLGALGLRQRVSAGTFHAVAFAMLRQRWADQRRAPLELLDRKVRLLAPLLGAPRRAGRGPAVGPADIAGEIEWAKARMIRAEHYAEEVERLGRRTPLPPGTLADLYRRYEETKKTRRLIDFDDLLGLCANALERDNEFAAAQRWRFRHLFVDEFQDVNPLQFRLLNAWRGDRRDLCVVGDPDQAIYGWNGADADYLANFARHFADATVVRLRDNYRSTPEVLRSAHAVLSTLANPSPPLNANRANGIRPSVTAHPDDAAEARIIARRIRDGRQPGRSWSAFAVLARTNAQLARLEEALRTAGVPYRLRGGSSLLDQPDVKALLRNRPRGDQLEAWLADLADVAHEGRMESHFGTDGSDGAEAALPPERLANLEALIRLGHEYLALSAERSVEGFHAWLSATLQHDDAGSGAGRDVVDLATFHAAKGLEWPVVFLAGIERGLVPIGHATSSADRDEEVRLFYVALTRARDELHLSWAERRDLGTRISERSPSPWLAVIEAAHAERSSVIGAAHVREAKARRGALAVTAADEPVLAALKAWRLGEARAASVPAYVIFSDATLAAVASARPRSTLELSRVPGVGPVKLSRYGERVLSILASAS